MARNVEIKAQVDDLASLRARVVALTSAPLEVLVQRDTFFVVPRGRLKLRRFFDGTGELIFYERPDYAGPRESSYIRCHCPDPTALASVLTQALGVRGVVDKRREVFLVGHARIHLDEVHGVGTFMEIEVVLQEGEAVTEGEQVVRQLLAALGIPESSLVENAYIDLLASA